MPRILSAFHPDHWFELAHPSTWSVMTPACLMQGSTCLRTFLAKQDGVQQLHNCTLSREEQCGRRTNLKSTCASTTPQLSERAGADACLSTLHSKIDPSELAAKGVCERGGYATWGGRLLSVLSRQDLIEVLSALLLGEEQIVGGVLELAYYRAAGDGQAFPTRERYRVLD